MANSFMGRMKRKGTTDIEAEYCYGEVLASSKRFRLDPDLPIFSGEQQCVAIACDDIPVQTPELPKPVEILELQQPTEPPAMGIELLPGDATDEKAIVLYKPVNPPIFPGGPTVGSSDLPIKFNTNCFAIDGGTWQINGTESLSNLFQFVSQTSSIPILKASKNEPVDNTLAVVPWVPSRFSTTVEDLSSDQKAFSDNVTNNEDQMAIDEDNVVSMEEDSVQPSHPTITCNNVTNEMGPDGMQWQHCMTPQPPVNPQVMWSY